MLNDLNYNDIFSLLSDIQSNKDIEETIINAIKFTAKQNNSDACLLYKISSNYLNLEYIHVNSLRLDLKGSSCNRFFTPVHILESKNKKIKTAAEVCALTKDIVNSPNIHNEKDLNTSNLKNFDLEYNYNCISLLSIPLFDNNENVIAVLCFINAKDSSEKIINFTKYVQDRTLSLCQLISLLIEKQQQTVIYHNFIESFISVLSKIIYSKSPSVASHNQKVPIIAQMLAIAMTTSSDGPFKDFEMSTNDWNVLNISALLHDCGKTIVPDYILNKSTKLEACTNRIHEIRTRFEILRRDAHIEYLQKRLNNVADKETLQSEFVAKVKKLHDDFEFIGKCNLSDSLLSDKDITKIDEIASQTYTRYFSRTVGLSEKELENISPHSVTIPETENLIQDRSEQISNTFNNGELFNLKTRKGILNSDESNKIKEHAANTSDILSEIPFPKEYADIIEIVKSHKNIMKELKYQTNHNFSKTETLGKIIAFSSTFEQLSAKETPHTQTKKLSEVLKIMQAKKNAGNLDPNIYNLFIKNNIYLDYAKEFLDDSQIDEINVEDIL